MKKKWKVGATFMASLLLLAACKDESGKDLTPGGTVQEEQQEETGETTESTEHAQMNYSTTGEVPEDLRKAEDPAFPIGSDVLIRAGHTKDMETVEGTVVGAYETTAYMVSYEPSDGGDAVKNYKWIIHEEIEEAGPDLFARGEEVVLDASHAAGMHGADAYIETVEATTVYMVDYVSPTGEEVTNHKWFVEEELSEK
ncbi:MAG: YdhK family protein [Lysinibacillus sp.]